MKRSGRAPLLAPVPTLGACAPNREVDAELSWFFMAEDGNTYPSNFGRMLASVTDDGEWRTLEEHARAVRRHRVIRSHLKSIHDSDAGVLQCAYAPVAWPSRLERELGRLTGVVVRLACDRATWPEERGRQLRLDAENAEMLVTMLRAGGDENRQVLGDLRREANARFGRALEAYVAARRGRSSGRMQ